MHVFACICMHMMYMHVFCMYMRVFPEMTPLDTGTNATTPKHTQGTPGHVSIHMYVYECIYVYACMFIYECMLMYMHVSVSKCQYMYVSIYMYVCQYMHVYMYMFVYMYMYVCM